MSSMERIVEDLTRLSHQGRDFVGDFLYAPFGIETSDMVNNLTMWAILCIAIVIGVRLGQPVHRARASKARSKYDLGRNV